MKVISDLSKEIVVAQNIVVAVAYGTTIGRVNSVDH